MKPPAKAGVLFGGGLLAPDVDRLARVDYKAVRRVLGAALGELASGDQIGPGGQDFDTLDGDVLVQAHRLAVSVAQDKRSADNGSAVEIKDGTASGHVAFFVKPKIGAGREAQEFDGAGKGRISDGQAAAHGG